jgi:hypothetical protein
LALQWASWKRTPKRPRSPSPLDPKGSRRLLHPPLVPPHAPLPPNELTRTAQSRVEGPPPPPPGTYPSMTTLLQPLHAATRTRRCLLHRDLAPRNNSSPAHPPMSLPCARGRRSRGECSGAAENLHPTPEDGEHTGGIRGEIPARSIMVAGSKGARSPLRPYSATL